MGNNRVCGKWAISRGFKNQSKSKFSQYIVVILGYIVDLVDLWLHN